jgi:hypothetical protein
MPFLCSLLTERKLPFLLFSSPQVSAGALLAVMSFTSTFEECMALSCPLYLTLRFLSWFLPETKTGVGASWVAAVSRENFVR